MKFRCLEGVSPGYATTPTRAALDTDALGWTSAETGPLSRLLAAAGTEGFEQGGLRADSRHLPGTIRDQTMYRDLRD